MHESLVVKARDDEHRVILVLAELHHGVVGRLPKLSPRRARHVPLQVLAQSLENDKTETKKTSGVSV